jgi:hypothetical protein
VKRSATVPIGEYCRRDNRVYAACPLGNNWESCILHADCLLLSRTCNTGAEAEAEEAPRLRRVAGGADTAEGARSLQRSPR